MPCCLESVLSTGRHEGHVRQSPHLEAPEEKHQVNQCKKPTIICVYKGLHEENTGCWGANSSTELAVGWRQQAEAVPTTQQTLYQHLYLRVQSFI